MAMFVLHAWIRFDVGLIAGIWIGVIAGVGLAALLAARRMGRLESANTQLRLKLQTLERTRRKIMAGAGPVLVPSAGVNRPASAPLRAVGGR